MIITSKRFTLQPSTAPEAHALRDAIDMAADAGDSRNPAALVELEAARKSLGNMGSWRSVDGVLVALELCGDALALVAIGLNVLADWIDDPDYTADAEGLTSTQVRELAGVIDAWLLTA